MIDWTEPGYLQTTIAHELGHVFGNPHVDGTLMDADFVKRAWSGDPDETMRSYIGRIDQERELVRCIKCNQVVYHGRIRRNQFMSMERQDFEALTGVPAPSPFTYTLDVTVLPASDNMTIVLNSAAGRFEFPVRRTPAEQRPLSSASPDVVFTTLKTSTSVDGIEIVRHEYDATMVIKGVPVRALIRWNDDSTPLNISAQLPGMAFYTDVFTALSPRYRAP